MSVSFPSETHLRQNLADAYHIASHFGWDDLIYSHFSVRIPSEPNCYLINPFGLLFDEITPENILKIDLDGNIVGDNYFNYNPAGENLHGALYKNRSDVNAVIHLHTINGMALSALKEGLLPISQHGCHFYGQVAYHDYEGIATQKSEQETITRDLGDKNILIMRNHGFLTVGENLQEAFCTMYTLEKAATVQMLALSSGREIILPSDEICQKMVSQTKNQKAIKNYDLEWQALTRILYKNKAIFAPSIVDMMISTDDKKGHTFYDDTINVL